MPCYDDQLVWLKFYYSCHDQYARLHIVISFPTSMIGIACLFVQLLPDVRVKLIVVVLAFGQNPSDGSRSYLQPMLTLASTDPSSYLNLLSSCRPSIHSYPINLLSWFSIWSYSCKLFILLRFRALRRQEEKGWTPTPQPLKKKENSTTKACSPSL